jgi:hypothetical protein
VPGGCGDPVSPHRRCSPPGGAARHRRPTPGVQRETTSNTSQSSPIGTEHAQFAAMDWPL